MTSPRRAAIAVDASQVEITAVRSQGPGGQNVNKVSTAVQLRFDIRASSLPDDVKVRLLALGDSRIGSDGVLVLKAQTHRSQGRNRADALVRLQALVDSVAAPPTPRKATKPTWGSKQRRLQEKARHSQVKAGRRGRSDD